MTEKEENELLAFAAKWAPYGGPPSEEVLVDFGMMMPRYESILREISAKHTSKRSRRQKMSIDSH
ncbi:hypothetical protein MX572_04230 [Rhodococcus pyridinivorans]|uniref:hypothetical protein n=1 Tax=Rhodococcus pyridinivorans TaxID=103816 RepID=UPI0020C66015|nr:hypothetical protein [Rhodococcus pyridinivorans]UTM38016.1 hypothetical protein MX572_04230 [Rhodococcus pyridinivorans]